MMDAVVDLPEDSCCSTSKDSPCLQQTCHQERQLPYTPPVNRNLPYLMKEKDAVQSEKPFPSFYCHGIKVLFPRGKKPYPVQRKMIFKLLQTLKGVKPESARATLSANPDCAATKVFNLKPPDRDGLIPGNCLLESPTGTGKTIALLSAALSWLQHEKDQIRIQYEKDDAEFQSRNNPEISVLDPQEVAVKLEDVSKMDMEFNQIKSKSNSPKCPPYSPVIQRSPLKPHSVQNSPLLLPTGFPYDDDVLTHDDSNVSFYEAKEEDTSTKQFQPPINQATLPPPKCPKPPRIFYGTRTHKQIKQIVSELKKMPYAKDIKMTTLSSRQQSCVKDDPSGQNRPKDAICHELLAPHGLGCGYHKILKTQMRDSAKMVRKTIEINDKVDCMVFDIEDLQLVGKEGGFCPYFAGTRTLMQDAELIFCPYNYLIDPIVRESMDLDLTGHVVILDEGHNVEDNCMESASFSLDTFECSDALEAFKEYHDFHLITPHNEDLMAKKTAAYKMIDRCNTITEWLQTKCTNLPKPQYSSEHYATEKKPGSIQFQLEKELGFDAEMGREAFQKDFATLCKTSDDKELESNSEEMRPPVTALRFVEKITHLLKFFYSTPEAKENYRLCFQKQEASRQPKKVRGQESFDFDEKFSAGFWCMNPALAFRDAFGTCRSVIIASGTLTPMNTFASELGTDFLHKLEGEHIVPKDNFRIFALPKGPNGHILKCTYKEIKEPAFKDDLGGLVLSVCECVPDGVLCFVASYSLLYDLEERWKQEGILARISKYKEIFFEPRGSSDKTDDVATRYFKTLYDLKKYAGNSGINGALLVAVMRGKISEGMDFNDEYARAVITVGIPYPSFADPKVQLKREFNDQRHSRNSLVLNGAAWYETQAFRALNQSLGRCLRYKEDWGSIIMVDQRFVDPCMQAKYRSGVSKWVRSDIKSMNNFQEFTHELQEFSQKMLAKTEEANSGARVVSTKPSKTAAENKAEKRMYSMFRRNSFQSPMVGGTRPNTPRSGGVNPRAKGTNPKAVLAKKRKRDVLYHDDYD